MKKVLIIEFAVVGVLLATLLYLFRGNIYNQLKEWKVVPLPETFTELYYTDHLNLPTTISAGQNQAFEFTISNIEDKAMTYNWVVYAVQDKSYVFKGGATLAGSTASREVVYLQTTETTQSIKSQEEQEKEEKENEEKILMASGRESILNGHIKNIGVSFNMDQVFARQKIVVELVDMDQTIHYWVTGR